MQATALKELVLTGGIGRELYTSPFIWISIDKLTTYDNKGKLACRDSFYVEAIEITNKVITGLAIKNNRNERVFTFRNVKEAK